MRRKLWLTGKRMSDEAIRIGVVTLFPEMFQALNFSITKRAQKKNLLKLFFYNPRDFSHNKHLNVDDKPYGGGPGMVMMVQPLRDAILAAKNELGAETPVVFLSPQGKTVTQAMLENQSQEKCLILVAGRYEGIDERLIETDIDEEWSMGDFVMSGGELPAMCVIDAITRLLPNVLGDDESAKQDSFSSGLLDYPHYTRPEKIEGQEVPAVLLGGDHEKIRRWRLQQALGRTWLRRPDLLALKKLAPLEQQLLEEFKCKYATQSGEKND